MGGSELQGFYNIEQKLSHVFVKGDDMKAVSVFPGTQTFKIVEHETPRSTQPDQVMLQMLDVGICGTDREICSFEYGIPPREDDYLLIGHEALAQVEDG